MWEIEQSSRTTLVKIVAGRMLIIGVINLFLITVNFNFNGIYLPEIND